MPWVVEGPSNPLLDKLMDVANSQIALHRKALLDIDAWVKDLSIHHEARIVWRDG